MAKEYDNKTLKKLQKLELDILKDFISVCDKYNLDYFAIGGTCIGVLRHKGFIPWDDDIDIALPRNDYEKFIEVIENEFPDKYTVMNAENFENYPLMTTRLMLKGTQFREYALKDVDCPLGIFLDVYAFDNVSDNEKKMKRQALSAWFWGKLLILRTIPYPVLPFKGLKAKAAHFVTACIYYFLYIFRFSKKYIYGKAKKASMRYNDAATKNVAYFCDTDRFANFISKDDLYPLTEYDFEDIRIKCPKNMHDMLVAQYGDYMKLPPVEKRKNHYPYILDFGKYDE